MQIEGLENFNSKNRDLSTSIQATIKNVVENRRIENRKSLRNEIQKNKREDFYLNFVIEEHLEATEKRLESNEPNFDFTGEEIDEINKIIQSDQ